jgi:hypothetical protein
LAGVLGFGIMEVQAEVFYSISIITRIEPQQRSASPITGLPLYHRHLACHADRRKYRISVFDGARDIRDLYAIVINQASINFEL